MSGPPPPAGEVGRIVDIPLLRPAFASGGYGGLGAGGGVAEPLD